jgi:hypothetical protein
MKNGKQRSLVGMLVLMLVTFGFYYLYWVYKTTKDIEKFTGEKGIPAWLHVVLFVCTATIWVYVWDLIVAQKIARMQESVGIAPKNNGFLYLMLDALGAGPVAGLGIVVPFLQQAEINEIYAAADAKESHKIW